MLSFTNKYNPQFLCLPVNNNRTAWRPYSLPILLVVPCRRNAAGQPIENSDINCVTIYIESVPNASLVVGPNHIIEVLSTDTCGSPIVGTEHFEQLQWPNTALYSLTFNRLQMVSRAIHPDSVIYYNYINGEFHKLDDRSEATIGSYYQYTCANGVTDYIPYLPDADYYDFSHELISVEPLPPDWYVLIYQCDYYQRVVNTTSSISDYELLCINTTTKALGISRFLFNHPGEIIGEWYRLTPSIYLTNVEKALDTTVSIYRPLTDSLQDIYDEQSLLKQVNWINKVPNQYIPYLSTLLGWDLPYFPNSTENMQRTLLKNTAWLQSIKGSRAAIVEVFRLLGIEILINNLWWSSDGKIHIAPGENLDYGYTNEQIRITGTQQLEPLLVSYNTNGIGNITVPLLHRPQIVSGLDNFIAVQDGGDIYITSYLVKIGSDAHNTLIDIVNSGSNGSMLTDPTSWSHDYESVILKHLPAQNDHLYEKDYISQQLLDYHYDQNGLIVPISKLDGLGSYSQVRLLQNLNCGVASGPLALATSQVTINNWTAPAVTMPGILMDRGNNRINITFNGYIDFTGDFDLPGPRVPKMLFVFASYIRQVYTIPASIKGLQSNWFNIQLLQANISPFLPGVMRYVKPAILDYAMELLWKVKAFHSILNKAHTVIDLTETWESTNICVGGNIAQRYDTMMGRLQVPPAILPRTPSEDPCDLGPFPLGYKSADIVYRLMKLANLPEEHAAWKALDNKFKNSFHQSSYRDSAEVYSITGPRIAPIKPAIGRTECRFNPTGQDRVLVQTATDVRTTEAGPSPNAAQFTIGSGQGITISPDITNNLGIYPTSGTLISTNRDVSAFGWFMRQYTNQNEIPLCEVDSITDYCYKGRALDELLYRLELPCREVHRNKPTGLQLGTGVYWTYSAISRQVIAGCEQPSIGSLTENSWFTAGAKYPYILNYKYTDTKEGKAQSPYLNSPYNVKLQDFQDTYLGKLYQAYGNPRTQTLHYGNRKMPISWNQTATIALQRPSIDCQLPTLHFPGCRFPMLIGLKQNFVSECWLAKPWDDPYCQGCGNDLPWLNAELVPDNFGNMILNYEQIQYAITGNGLDPDIPSLDGSGSLDRIPPEHIVHAVYTCTNVGHLAITLDAVDYSRSITEITGTMNPLFSTYSNCEGNVRKSQYMVDYIDGYPSSTGEKPVDYSSSWPNYNRNGAIFEDLPDTSMFFLGDGILETTGYRLDAFCLTAGCDYSDQVLSCNTLVYDPCTMEEDLVEIDAVLICQEVVGINNLLLDGTIPSLFELLPSCPNLNLLPVGAHVLPMMNNMDIRCMNIPTYDPSVQEQELTFAGA